MTDEIYLYRYETQRYSVVIDANAEIYGSSKPELQLHEYEVLRNTPKGFWIANPRSYGKDKWVNNYATKRFAYLSKDDAMDSFRARKKRQIHILSAQLENAKEDLGLVEGSKELAPWTNAEIATLKI